MGEEKDPSDILRGGREEKQRTEAEREGINRDTSPPVTHDGDGDGDHLDSRGTTRDRFKPSLLHSDPHPPHQEGPVLDHQVPPPLSSVHTCPHLPGKALLVIVGASRFVVAPRAKGGGVGEQIKNTALLSKQTASCHLAELEPKTKPT